MYLLKILWISCSYLRISVSMLEYFLTSPQTLRKNKNRTSVMQLLNKIVMANIMSSEIFLIIFCTLFIMYGISLCQLTIFTVVIANILAPCRRPNYSRELHFVEFTLDNSSNSCGRTWKYIFDHHHWVQILSRTEKNYKYKYFPSK